MRAQSIVAVVCASLAFAACTVKKTEQPPLSGPSEFALSLSMSATPDAISYDGGSQSAIRIAARGPDGRGIASLTMRVDTVVNGVAQDFGTLSARTIVTGSDGVASVVYTAPRKPAGGNTGTCNGLPGTCVTVVATPSGSNFEAANPQLVTIRLVPPGVILPPAGSPTAAFTFSPSPPSVAVPLIFDASSSSAGANSQITSYSWNFGDGTGTAEGQAVSHTFSNGGTFNVTLTVTNDRGLSDSDTQAVTVAATDPFTGDWTFSPATPLVGQSIVFNASQVQTSAGQNVVQYSWDFGDGTTGSGAVTTHTYAEAGGFNVVLSVVDDLGRRKVFGPKQVTVGTGNPIPSITFSPSSPRPGDTVIFDASGTLTAPGATIVSYSWNFGDGATSSSGPTASHSYTSAGARTVRVTVSDNLGRTGTATVTVTIVP
jgi:PKD repeat protein